MTQMPFEIFLPSYPGLEETLLEEVVELGFSKPQVVAGGVTIEGSWPDVWRANLWVRGATRVLARIASFRAMHPAQLDKRARKVDWGGVLRPDKSVKVEATCRKSRIYHAGAAQTRVETAIAETVGCVIAKEADITVRVRIEDDLCTLSVDTSGSPLHLREHKQFVGKAPLRETLAALCLRACGFDGTGVVLDPMCGSGTFVLEAAEIATNLPPGRSRRFAFESLVGFDAEIWENMRRWQFTDGAPTYRGFDRDQGAIQGARKNAERAGLSDKVVFSQQAMSAFEPPDVVPGLIMINPPYGARIGKKHMLYGLYGALGERLKSFEGWRVGLVTSVPGLARATGLSFKQTSAPIPNGGLKVKLYQSVRIGS